MSQTFALALTLLVEVPLVFAVARGEVHDRVRLVALACAASLLTHPFAWYANERLVHLPFYLVRAPLIEGSVVVLEALLYRALLVSTWRRAFVASALANTCSFTLGLVVYYARAALLS